MPKKNSVKKLSTICIERIAGNINYFMRKYRRYDLNLFKPQRSPKFGPFADMPTENMEELLLLLDKEGNLDINICKIILPEKKESLDIFYNYKWTDEQIIKLLAIASKRCKKLKNLRMYAPLFSTSINNKLDIALKSFRNLVKICFCCLSIHNGTVKIISRTCKNLRYLNLERTGIDDHALSYLYSNRSVVKSTLVYLNILDNEITDNAIASAIMYLPSIRNVISHSLMESLVDIYYLYRGNRSSVHASTPYFYFDVLMGDFEEYNQAYTLDIEILQEIISMCYTVTTLVLESVPKAMYYTFEYFATLNVSCLIVKPRERRNSQIFPALMKFMLLKGENLISLTLHDFEDVCMATIAEMCSNLQHLTLICNSYKEKENFFYFPNLKSVAVISKIPPKVKFSKSEIEGFGLSADNVLSFLCSPDLESATFEDQNSLNDFVLQQALERCGLEHVQKLSIFNCQRVTPQSIWALLKTDNALKHLEISECNLVSKYDIKQFEQFIRQYNLDVQIFVLTVDEMLKTLITDYGRPQCPACPFEDHTTPFKELVKKRKINYDYNPFD